MEARRAIALLVSLAMLLAGPLSPLLAMGAGECCCASPEQATELVADSCCAAEAQPERKPGENRAAQGADEDAPHSDGCDCPVQCCTAGKTMPLNRAGPGLELPDDGPEAWRALEPESHAIEPSFSLMRPPKA